MKLNRLDIMNVEEEVDQSPLVTAPPIGAWFQPQQQKPSAKRDGALSVTSGFTELPQDFSDNEKNKPICFLSGLCARIILLMRPDGNTVVHF